MLIGSLEKQTLKYNTRIRKKREKLNLEGMKLSIFYFYTDVNQNEINSELNISQDSSLLLLIFGGNKNKELSCYHLDISSFRTQITANYKKL